MKLQLKNRFLIVSIAFLISAVLTGGVYLNKLEKFSPVSSAEIVLNGAAIETFRQRGDYDSLAAAMTAARYQIEKREGGEFYAQNPANRMRAVFSGAGNFQLQSARKDSAWQTDWRLKTIGYGTEQTKIPAGILHSNGSRVERRRDEIGLIEYFENQPDGLEQGFILNRKPAGNSADKLRLTLQIDGELRALASADGQTINLFDASGAQILSYEKLKAWDANGTPLSAAMSVADAEIQLEVEEANALYPITIDPTFVGQRKLTASDGAANDAFGSSVSIYLNHAIVGSPNDDVGADADQGSAYIFKRNGVTWTQEQKIVASDGLANDHFGTAVSINSNLTVVVGAPDDDIVSNINQGSAYEFTYNSTTDSWTQNRKLTATDGAANDNLGSSVANQAYLLIGSPNDDNGAAANQGSIYLFNQNSTVVTQLDKATASDGAAGDNFGSSFDYISLPGVGGTVVGAPLDDLTGGTDQGSAYIFEIDSPNLIQRVKVMANDGATGDRFGTSVSSCGETGAVCVGAPFDDVNSNADQGSVYVFKYDNLGLAQQAKLTAGDGAAGDAFGSSLESSQTSGGNKIIVGAPADDVGSNADQGSVYVFLRGVNLMTWLPNSKITATGSAAGDAFGTSLAVSERTFIAGSTGDDITANVGQGSANIFVANAANDFNGDGVTDYTVFRPTNNTWYSYLSPLGYSGQVTNTLFGITSDLLAPGDYDGDNRTDVAVFRPSNGTWYLQQSTNGFTGITFGQSGDLPRPGDYDGDHKADICVFRPSNGVWYRLNSSSGQFIAQAFGTSGDRPVIADFDGDDKSDIAVFRPSNGSWYWTNSSNGQVNGVAFGQAGDVPMPADFDGDGKTDVAVFRNGIWYIQQSTVGFIGIAFGIGTDIPVVGDYSGSGKSSIGVFRPSNGYWYWTNITGFGGGSYPFGANGDRPVPAAFN